MPAKAEPRRDPAEALASLSNGSDTLRDLRAASLPVLPKHRPSYDGTVVRLLTLAGLDWHAAYDARSHSPSSLGSVFALSWPELKGNKCAIQEESEMRSEMRGISIT